MGLERQIDQYNDWSGYLGLGSVPVKKLTAVDPAQIDTMTLPRTICTLFMPVSTLFIAAANTQRTWLKVALSSNCVMAPSSLEIWLLHS